MKRPHFISIKTKFYILAGIVLAVAIFSSMMSSYLYNEAVDKYKILTTGQTYLNNFYKSNKVIRTVFLNYMIQPTTEHLLSYEGEVGQAKALVGVIIENSAIEEYKVRFAYLANMMDSFDEQARKAIHLIGSNKETELRTETAEALYINELIDYSYMKYADIFSQSLDESAEQMVRSLRTHNIQNMILITTSLLGIVFAFLFFSNNITRPIIMLEKNASEISRQNLDTPIVSVRSNDEIGNLTKTFESMRVSLLEYLNKINEQTKLEQMLIQEENEYLRMLSLLKDARLKTLQTQINSHFLFNTLNLISRTAYIEGAPQTIQLLETTTDFLRYSLTKAKSNVKITDEIAFAEMYVTIQKLRFGDRISFDMLIDDPLPDMQVPPLLIQPLIENAIMHGTYNKIEPSRVKVIVQSDDTFLKISVEDDGIGVPEDKLPTIFLQENVDADDHGDNKSKTVSGIGLRTMRERLKMFAEGKNEIFVTSEYEKFFRAEIRIELNQSITSEAKMKTQQPNEQ